MARDAYHEIYLHLNWHTKEDRPLIPAEAETWIYSLIRKRALQDGRVFVHEIGRTENHVHIVFRFTPMILLCDWIGRLKGGSSYDINSEKRLPFHLQWQDGYGVVGFGEGDLPWVVNYVRNQKEHHRKGTTFDRLERFTDDDE